MLRKVLSCALLAIIPLPLTAQVTDALVVDNQGAVGVGTATPSAPLHVTRDDGSANLLVEETDGAAGNQNLLTLRKDSAAPFQRYISAFGTWDFSAGNFFVINDPADAAIEFRQEKDGDLTIGGTLTQNSSRAAKHRIETVDTGDVLDKVTSLPVQHWTYIDDREQARHLGPMAEDFAEAFNLGADNTHISSLDLSGVALAAIQELKKRQDARIETLQQENRELRSELDELRVLVDALGARDQVARRTAE